MNNFNDEILHNSRKSDLEFSNFIDEHLFSKKSKLSDNQIDKNIESLRTMNEVEFIKLKASAKTLEETNDVSKYFPALISLTLMLIAAYGSIATFLGKSSVTAENAFLWLTILISLILIFLLIRTYKKVSHVRSSAVYFNSLISNIEVTRNSTT